MTFTILLQEKKKVGAQVSHLKQLMADYSVPPALNYVESVREMRRLKRKEKIQNRKVAISKVRKKGEIFSASHGIGVGLHF